MKPIILESELRPRGDDVLTRSEGPQHVTVHGRDEVVAISAEEFRRLKGDITGDALS